LWSGLEASPEHVTKAEWMAKKLIAHEKAPDFVVVKAGAEESEFWTIFQV
jgi:hypothetical protein